MHPRVKDLTGQRFGRWLVVGMVGRTTKRRSAHWLCRCDCGTERVRPADRLTYDNSRGCGCENPGGRKTHGLAPRGKKRPEYYAWNNAKTRCYQTDHRDFPNYGGRGITMSDEWRSDFGRFFSDMGPRPSPHHTLERADNDGPYAAGNCAWADRKTQARNTRAKRLLTLDGVTMRAVDWAKAKGMTSAVLFGRLHRGWSVERTLTEPIHTKKSSLP